MWEVVADDLPDAPAQIHGDRPPHVGRVRPAGRRRRPARCSTPAGPSAGQGGPVPLQLPRVPRVDVRRVQGRRSSRSTPTTATPTTSSSTCGTTPTPVAVVFHGTFARRIERDPGPGAEGADVAVGRRRQRAAAPTGPTPYETAATSRRGAGRAAVGPQRRRPLPALHRRHHRHAQGRDVAPGRPGRRRSTPSLREPALGRGRHDRRPARHASPRRASRVLPACPLMHGTGCFTVPVDPVGRRVHRHARRTATSTSSSCSTRSSARASTRSRSSATRSPSRCCARSTTNPAVGPLEPRGDRVVRRDVERGDQAGPARAPSRRCC